MSALDVAMTATVGAIVISMPVFAIVSRGRPLDHEVAVRGRTVMFGYWIRDWLMWIVGPVERTLLRLGVGPTALNVVGALFGLGSGVLFARGALAGAGAMLLLGGVADILDGRVARARGVASELGAFLDSTLDRFAEAFAFLGIVWYFQGRPLLVLTATAALAGSMLVSYTRARGESVGVLVTGGLMPRAERIVLLGAAGIADAAVANRFDAGVGTTLAAAVALIAAGTWLTAAYRTLRILTTLSR